MGACAGIFSLGAGSPPLGEGAVFSLGVVAVVALGAVKVSSLLVDVGVFLRGFVSEAVAVGSLGFLIGEIREFKWEFIGSG